MDAKETVRALLNRLPDDCSLDEVLYHLYVLQEVAKGRADVEAGRTMPHAEVAEQLRRKWRHTPREVIWTQRAREALDEAAASVAEDSPEAAVSLE